MLDGKVSLTIYDCTDQSYVERNGKRMVQENCWYTAQNATLAEKVRGSAETKMKPVDSESRDMLHSFFSNIGPGRTRYSIPIAFNYEHGGCGAAACCF